MNPGQGPRGGSGRGPRQGSRGGWAGRDEQRGELFRAEDTQSLRWLEAEDDEEETDRGDGLDARRTARVIGIGLAATAVLAATGWCLISANEEPDIAATGAIIEAPPGPYKLRPADPGGIEVAGTGDVSFAVSEGELREGRLADGAGSVTAGADRLDGASSSAAGDADVPGSRDIAVQIGAFSSRDEAAQGWAFLKTRIPVLEGRGHRITEGPADAGTVFRLQALAGSANDAATLCSAIRADGGECQIKD